MYNKIVNPNTGRKINTSSKLGKKILKNYFKQLGGKPDKDETPELLDESDTDEETVNTGRGVAGSKYTNVTYIRYPEDPDKDKITVDKDYNVTRETQYDFNAKYKKTHNTDPNSLEEILINDDLKNIPEKIKITDNGLEIYENDRDVINYIPYKAKIGSAADITIDSRTFPWECGKEMNWRKDFDKNIPNIQWLLGMDGKDKIAGALLLRDLQIHVNRCENRLPKKDFEYYQNILRSLREKYLSKYK
tara:strand:+ start:1074 stop:1814 length:741 start_codon:yes stop_codon:yes gene_type:complete